MAGAVLWSLPMLAAGLVALLRYGFGSVFVVGESVARALLRSTGSDIGVTVAQLDVHPVPAALEAAGGLLLSAGAGRLAFRQPGLAAALAALSGAEAWWYGMPLASAVLAPAAMCAIVTVRG